MRLVLLSAVLWTLTGCSAVTLSVRGQATVPALYSRPSLAMTSNGAQVVGRTEEVAAGKPLRGIGLSIRNANNDRLIEVDWREMSLVGNDGKPHPVRPGGNDTSAPVELLGAITIPPQQTARLDVTPVDDDLHAAAPTEPKEGTVVTPATLRIPVHLEGTREVAELPVTYSTEADVPSEARPKISFAYTTRVPFEPGLAGLMGTMCFLTSSYFGGLCWLYLIFPTSDQKSRAVQEAASSLKEEYGSGAVVLSSEVQQIGW